MGFCLTLAIGVMCSSAPRLTPQQAADILRPNAYQALCGDCDGPRVAIAPYTPPPFRIVEPRRLDGTLLSQPPFFLRYRIPRDHGRRR